MEESVPENYLLFLAHLQSCCYALIVIFLYPNTMKRLLALLSLSFLTLAACTSSGAPDAMEEQGESSSSVMMEEDGEDADGEAMEEEADDEDAEGGPEGAMEAEGGVEVKVEGEVEEETEQPSAAATRVIEITVDNWSFSPATITAKKGEKVEIKLVGTDGAHSFAVPALSINTPVSAGETKTVMLPTGEAGTFEFLCRIPCGEGHKDMRGTIVIE